MKNKKVEDAYTPGELYDEHKDALTFIRWDASKIGIFFTCYLLEGFRNRGEKKT